MSGLQRIFVVRRTGEIKLQAYIYRDDKRQSNQIVVGISPRFEEASKLSGLTESVIISRAREEAIQLVAELTGMPVEDLTTERQTGVGTITVNARESKAFPPK